MTATRARVNGQDPTSNNVGVVRGSRTRERSGHEHANADVAYEALSPVRIQRMSLRSGSVLLVTVGPPSDILPSHLRGHGAPDIGVPMLVEVELGERGTVREGLASILYLPGTVPDEAAVAGCIARYPDHDAKRSAMRCGQAAD